MKQFQYESTIVMTGEDAIGELNKWGVEGWEVIDVFRPVGCAIYTFKREVAFEPHLNINVDDIHNHPATMACTRTCPYFNTPLRVKGE